MKILKSGVRLIFSALLFSSTLLFSGETVKVVDKKRSVLRPTVEICYIKGITPENVLKNPVWNKLPEYRFYANPYDLEILHRAPIEEGRVKFAYDDKYLYVRAELEDSDIMTIGTENQTHLYLMGDLLEIFIKPLEKNYYWEVYGTPNKLFTRFYFPSRGLLGVPSVFGPTDVKIPVDAEVNGTFNQREDRDKSWSVAICVPRKELEKNGLKFEAGNAWTIFVSRYNYSRYLQQYETSSFPQVTGSFHATDYYSNVKFVTDKN